MDLRVVPWSTLEEFRFVKEHILSDDAGNRQTGLDLISVWRARVPTLPAGVETSSYLVAALDMDEGCRKELPRLTLATALVRFVNLVSHLGQKSQYHQNIVDVAIAMNVPQWLVKLRHDVTHGQMPSVEALTNGAKQAMKWLKENYWDVEETRLRDWTIVKEVSSKKKKKKNNGNEISWKQLRGFRKLHEGLDLHFFLLDLAAAKIHALNQLADPSLKQTISESISKQGLILEEFRDVTALSRGLLDKIIAEIETLCEVNQVEPPGVVFAQLVSEGDYLGVCPSKSSKAESSTVDKYRYVLRKLSDCNGIPTLMAELTGMISEDGGKSGGASDWFVEIGRSVIGQGHYKLQIKNSFDWLRLGKELMASPNEHTKKCLEILFDIAKIPKTSTHRQAAFSLLELKLKGPDDRNFEENPVLNGTTHTRKRTISETSTSSEMSGDLNYRDFLQKKKGLPPQDTTSYPIGWNADFRSLILSDCFWKSS